MSDIDDTPELIHHIPDHCEGFHFRYFYIDEKEHLEVIRPDEDAKEAENVILERVNEIFKHRPDLMRALACMEQGLEIHLYNGNGFEDFTNGIYFYGRATKNGEEVILEFATEEILQGGRPDGDVLDIVVHEITHILDYLDDHDGILPDWTDDDVATFKAERQKERRKIRDGKSPLVGYALTNDEEFLAVLAETYFIKPAELYQSNPTLYRLMSQYFKQNFLAEAPTAA